MENRVRCFCNSSNNSYSGFLERFKNNNADLIIKDFRSVAHDGDWFWSRGVKWIYGDVPLYGGFFPVVRLSNEAVDYLYNKRLKFGGYDSIEGDKIWPFCELFVPTELMQGGFSCCELDEHMLIEDTII